MNKIKTAGVVVVLWLSATVGQATTFVTDIEPWGLWTASTESVTDAIAHEQWQALLDAYLRTDTADGIYRFDYGAVSKSDRQRLQAYLGSLTAIDPRNYPRSQQLPYWINLYNALTVAVVLEHYPVSSIRKIYGGLFNTGPWDETLIEVAGVGLSLNDIEHRILRPIWRDPRIHYAVNCASLSCPNLAADAYTASNVERLLDEGARAYINHPRGVAVAADRIVASSIYDWYQGDFGGSESALVTHWLAFAEQELAAALQAVDGRFSYQYDWNLNE